MGYRVVRQGGGQNLPLNSPVAATVYAAHGHCQQSLREPFPWQTLQIAGERFADGRAQRSALQHFRCWCIQSNRSRRGFSSRKAALAQLDWVA
jgi:hypothetical protein